MKILNKLVNMRGGVVKIDFYVHLRAFSLLSVFQRYKIENPQKVGGYERGGHVIWAIFARSSDMQKLSLESCQACMNY